MCEHCATHNHTHDDSSGHVHDSATCKHDGVVLAVCGKGGVGKTSISAMTVRTLLEHDPGARVLAIDADPAVGLAMALGVEVARTVDDIRLEVIEAGKQGKAGDVTSILEKLDYEVFNALVEQKDFSFLAIGRPETEGCYCKVNDYLKEIIEAFIEHYDYVVIDCEAGVEQINRRVLENVSHLLLVSDSSKKGANVAAAIRELADKGVLPYRRAGLVVSRVHDAQEAGLISLEDVETLGFIAENSALRSLDTVGESLFALPSENDAMVAVKDILDRFGILGTMPVRS